MSNENKELFKILFSTFRVESKDRVQKITSDLLELEKEDSIEEKYALVESIFREIHSLKSAARAVDLTFIETICRNLETTLSEWKKTKKTPTAEELDDLHKINDALTALLNFDDEGRITIKNSDLDIIFSSLKNIKTQNDEQQVEHIKSSTRTQGFRDKSQNIDDSVRISSKKMDSLLVNTEEMLVTKINLIKRIDELNTIKMALLFHKRESEKSHNEKWMTELNKENVDTLFKKYSNYIDWNETSLKSLISNMEGSLAILEHDLHHFSNSLDLLLDGTKKLLMLPFSTLLDLLPKMVRDLSRDLNKEINLIIEGANIEIDKRILEELKSALIHFVRNAIDHGIELPDERVQLGKTRQGMLKVLVQQLQGNEVLVSIEDDGNGIDINEIKRIAITKEIVTEADAAALSDEEALELIYQSGLSTSRILTDLSGRGVGMSIIREKIEKMGGKINIYSKPHEGTIFKIKLPLTLATFKGITVEVSGEHFIIPTLNLVRIINQDPNQIKTIGGLESIRFEEEMIPLVWLADCLGLPRQVQKAEQLHSEKVPVLVIESIDKKMALIVDEVLHEQEILIKNFSKPLSHIENISAASILSSGKPILILNTTDLVHSVESIKTVKGEHSSDQSEAKATKKILLVEDSFTTRMQLKSILELGGYMVVTAVDGLEAWDKLQKDEFMAVVSDVEMPNMDGFKLTEKIRHHKQFSELPVILVTGLASQEDRERGIDVGANAYIVKNTFNNKQLLEIVQRFES